jgi:ABC-2 type transport system permease protein
MTRAFFRIVGRELRAAFASPVGYIVSIIFLTITGWFVFQRFFPEGRADLRFFFELLPLTLALVVPAVTMRVFAEELSTGSFEVLSTLPVTDWDVILGKFVGTLTFVLLMLTPTLLYPLIVARFGAVDWGPVVGGYLGAIFLSGLYCAVGMLTSALTRNQIVAVLVGWAVCFLLALVDDMLVFFPGPITNVVQYLGADFHFRSVARGVIDSRDLIYFVSAIFVALFGAHLAIERRK